MEHGPEQSGRVRLALGGDVMLGRGVGDAIQRHGPGYPLGQIAERLRAADLTIVNLECAMTTSTARWAGAPKAFYFRAPPSAAQSLAQAGVDLVSLANNHTLDFDVQGLRDTLHFLHAAGILHAGAGADLRMAVKPAIVERRGIRFGMSAFCDHQEDFAAGQQRPGIAYLDLNDERGSIAAFRSALDTLARNAVDWPVLSLHWGPNLTVQPAPAFRRLAHAVIEMGWRMVFGHSAHVFHGVEIYRGCPIFYAAGDLVDDYSVHPLLRNNHQLLFEIECERRRLAWIRVHTLVIDACQVLPANPAQSSWIADRFAERCAELGTDVRQEGGGIWIDGAGSGAPGAPEPASEK